MQNYMTLIHNDSLCCEPLMRRMPNGDLLCVCQCGDTFEPAPGNRVYAFRSSDDGRTWSKPVSIYPETGEAVYATELMVIDGTATAFLTVHSGRFLNSRCVMVKSTDSGMTWTDAGHPPFFETFCFIRSMLELKNGDIAIPYQDFFLSEAENLRLIVASHNITDPRRQKVVCDADIRAIHNGILLSHDRGNSWIKCEGPDIAIKGETGRNWAWTEPTIAELSDKTLVMLLRVCGTGMLWRSESRDGGLTWTEAVPTDIPNPSNKPRLLPLPDGRIALIHTPNPKPGFFNRNPLEIWISSDDMRTWPDKHTLSDMPFAFCYPDAIFENGRIKIVIEVNRHELLFIDYKL